MSTIGRTGSLPAKPHPWWSDWASLNEAWASLREAWMDGGRGSAFERRPLDFNGPPDYRVIPDPEEADD